MGVLRFGALTVTLYVTLPLSGDVINGDYRSVYIDKVWLFVSVCICSSLAASVGGCCDVY